VAAHTLQPPRKASGQPLGHETGMQDRDQVMDQDRNLRPPRGGERAQRFLRQVGVAEVEVDDVARVRP